MELGQHRYLVFNVLFMAITNDFFVVFSVKYRYNDVLGFNLYCGRSWHIFFDRYFSERLTSFHLHDFSHFFNRYLQFLWLVLLFVFYLLN
jgi:hypothetical protein